MSSLVRTFSEIYTYIGKIKPIKGLDVHSLDFYTLIHQCILKSKVNRITHLKNEKLSKYKLIYAYKLMLKLKKLKWRSQAFKATSYDKFRTRLEAVRVIKQ